MANLAHVLRVRPSTTHLHHPPLTSPPHNRASSSPSPSPSSSTSPPPSPSSPSSAATAPATPPTSPSPPRPPSPPTPPPGAPPSPTPSTPSSCPPPGPASPPFTSTTQTPTPTRTTLTTKRARAWSALSLLMHVAGRLWMQDAVSALWRPRAGAWPESSSRGLEMIVVGMRKRGVGEGRAMRRGGVCRARGGSGNEYP